MKIAFFHSVCFPLYLMKKIIIAALKLYFSNSIILKQIGYFFLCCYFLLLPSEYTEVISGMNGLLWASAASLELALSCFPFLTFVLKDLKAVSLSTAAIQKYNQLGGLTQQEFFVP